MKSFINYFKNIFVRGNIDEADIHTTVQNPWRVLYVFIASFILIIFLESHRILVLTEGDDSFPQNIAMRISEVIDFGKNEVRASVFRNNNVNAVIPIPPNQIASNSLFKSTATIIKSSTSIKLLTFGAEGNQPPPRPKIQVSSSTSLTGAKYRFLLIGDSFMADTFGTILEKSLHKFSDTEIFRRGAYSTGLNRSDYFDWNKEVKTLIDKHNSNIVLVMFGANDGQPIKTKNGTWVKYGDAGWDEEYLTRIDKFIEVLASSSVSVLWLGNSIAESPRYTKKIERLNNMYETEIHKYSSGHYITTWNLLRNTNNEYASYLTNDAGKLRQARSSDGIHVTSFGAELLIKGIIPKIKEIVGFEEKK